ncbi:MAG TPA: hypothetical protein VMS73_07745 [Anaerolineaceae bacterium]|nr:hypothetical protein [Anaerolineaceae bacterium]
MEEKIRWLLVVVYATAMAWVESAAVLYLRVISGRLQPYQVNPLPLNNSALPLGPVEMMREAATLVMLITVGWLAGRSRWARLGYFIIAFGIWDIFYYVFLHVMAGWPASLGDWDVLFLLPLPWWGPVLAPMLIALLLAIGGTLLVYFNQSGFQFAPGRAASLVCFGGVVLSLYVFMSDALRAVSEGKNQSAISNTLPISFNWLLFIPALILLSAPILDLIWQWRKNTTASG